MILKQLTNPTHDEVLPFFQSLTPVLIKYSVSDWPCFREYVLHGCPNIRVLEEAFGAEVVPVERDGIREEVPFSRFCAGWTHGENIYLKDFHWQRYSLLQSDMYSTPHPFRDDWLNSFACAKTNDDFRFLYLGTDGTRTSLHHDVYSSNSWSVNLCGQKAWTLIPPDVSYNFYDNSGDFVDDSHVESLIKTDPIRESVIHVLQDPGEILFVPSGWLHHVQNFGETLSLNHNFCNVYCLNSMFSFLELQYQRAEHGLRDLRDTVPVDELLGLVEAITGADSGMTWLYFFQMILWHFALKAKENGSVFRWVEASPSCRPSQRQEQELLGIILRRWTRSGFRKYKDADSVFVQLVEMLKLDDIPL